METGLNKLQKLLFDRDTELVNIKFFLGENPGSVEEFSEAAEKMIRTAMESGINKAPDSKINTFKLEDL